MNRAAKAKQKAKHAVKIVRRILTVAVVAVFALWVISATAVLIWASRDEARPAQAIVVLGAAQYAGKPSPVLRARLDHALDLWNRHLAALLILTG
jgi:vancomycin permeability regulator SanA